MEQASGKIENCRQNEPAFCTAACPFHLNVQDFMDKMQRGSFNLAFRVYQNAVGFPDIVSSLCDESCKKVCIRQQIDAPISMRLLEKSALSYATRTTPNSYNLPAKQKRVAIIGAGISGLACALRLAAQKYPITIFEKTNRIGGQLWNLLSPDIFLKDIEQQFIFESYTLSLNNDVRNLDDLNFDAIYVATGAHGNDFNLKIDPNGAFATKKPGVFIGGSLTGRNCIEALADGLYVASAIERYLKTGNMNHPFISSSTKLVLDSELIARSEAVIPGDGIFFTRDEALQEAKRCLKCSCDACMRYCDLMRFYKKFPKRIAEEVEITIHPGTLDGNGTVATRLITTCNQCGLCKEVCPEKIDVGDLLLVSHRTMRQKGAMPWAYHDFWLRDMDFSNSDPAQLCRVPAGYSRSSYMFFPGCQLGASDPQYVIESYRWMLEKKPDMALMLHCCGAPADWAGDEQIHSQVIEKIREQWIALGRPLAIFACPTCKQMFQRYLPEIKGGFLYDLLSELDFPVPARNREVISIFDPCSSRNEPKLQQSVRQLVNRAGLTHQPLPLEGNLAACCSWGGQVSIANPLYARGVVKARISQGNDPYITYCINCRDIFAAYKKPAYHILDILFGLHDSGRPAPTYTERRVNRVKLRNQVLQEFWKDEAVMETKRSSIGLSMDPNVRQKLNDEMILETEIETVIEYCEANGKKIIDPASRHFIGHLKIGNLTYWAEYLPVNNGYVLFNAYSHRMSIDE